MKVLQSPWIIAKGKGIEGLGDGNQYSAQFFLYLETGVTLELRSDKLIIGPSEATETTDYEPRGFEASHFLGAIIQEAAISENQELILLLSNGTYLEVVWGPSGNQLWGNELKSWRDSDKDQKFYRYWERDLFRPWDYLGQ